VTLALPTPVAALEYTFIVEASQDLIIDAGGSVVIGLGEIATSAGGSVSSNSPNSAITLKAISATLWVAISLIGTWSPA
jgi:hypothetical protein